LITMLPQIFFPPHGTTTPIGPGSPHYPDFTIRLEWDFSGRVIFPSQRLLPDNTQHSQETFVHAPGVIRARNSSKRATATPRVRPLGHWDRLVLPIR